MKDKGQWLDIDGWSIVPKNWDKWYCPSELNRNTTIEVLFRNGQKEVGLISNYEVSCVQENSQYDIVKYRVVNKSIDFDVDDHLGN